MKTLGLISVVLLFAVWSVLGVRFLLMARRTRSFPEFALGSAFFAQAGIGYPLHILASFLSGPPAVASILTSVVFLDLGTLLLGMFVQRVFRSEDRWAKGVVAVLAISLAAHVIGTAANVAAIASAHGNVAELAPFWSIALTGMAGTVMLWSGVEALLYRRALLRRVALGLGQPEVADRLGRWGAVGLLSAGVGCVDMLAFATSPEIARASALMLVNSLGGIVDSLLLLLAFMPPRAYVAWVRQRALRGEA